MNNERAILLLENTRIKRHIITGIAFAIMNVLTFGMFLFFPQLIKTGIAGLAVTGLYFLTKSFQRRKQPHASWIDEHLFFLLAVIWVTANSFMGIFVLLTGILFKISTQSFYFVLDHRGVRKDFFPKREYKWDEIDSVIWKAGLLTINFKNGRLIQGMAQPVGDITEDDFRELVDSFSSGDSIKGQDG